MVQSVSEKHDITIVGGGLAGSCAAIAAARLGARVALVNNRPMLGGNSSSEVRVWVCGATAHGAQKFARETGIMGELFLENQFRNEEGNPYYWDQVLLDAVRAEPGISLWLNTDVRDIEVAVEDDVRRISAVTGWQLGSERQVSFESELFIDASGDGLVGYLAGADYRLGREAHAELGEEWAPQAGDSHLLGSTLLLYTKSLGRPVRFVPPSIAKKIEDTPIVRHRSIRADANGCDYWWIEWGGQLDVVRDNERIRDELWAVVYGIWDYIKNSGKFDADDLTLEWVGSVPGKREYRRFLGDHVFSQHDVMKQVRFEDSIGFGGWSIDLHAFDGVYHAGAPAKNLFPAGIYHIPFRSLYSRNVENMMMAGRNVSASHVGFGTLRVMATCAVMGEAAGTGAALAVRLGTTPRGLVQSHRELLQQTLLRHDASIIGVPWTDTADKCLAASVRASSTLQSLAVEAPRGTSEPYALGDEDLAILLPAEPSVGEIELFVATQNPVVLTSELWETGGGENYLPSVHVATAEVEVSRPGPHWVALPFAHTPESPRNVVVVVKRAPGLSLPVDPGPGPYGVLAMASRVPRVERLDGKPQANKWDAAPFRRKHFGLRVATPTLAYAPTKIVGGYQRPFDGPQMWSSEALEPGCPESLELHWDDEQEITRIDVIFNDDVDEDLINLHHHHTDFDVVPELVRDYRIEARVNGRWVEVERVAGNRKRHRTHGFSPMATDSIRLIVDATNGSAWATVVAIRAF